MNLVLLLVVIWLVVRLMRGSGVLGHRGGWRDRRAGDDAWRGPKRTVRARSAGPSRKRSIGARPPALPPESPVDRLQRQFVAGELTVEEYEQQLDRVLKRG